MGFCCNGFGWGGTGGGLILNLVFFVGMLAVLGVGTVWLVRQLGRRPLAPAAGVDSLEIARRRLAAGEITAAEFEEIRDRLQR
jgi:uncharacterized membrane protein